MEAISDDKRNSVEYEPSNTVFWFGDGKRFKAIKRVTLPCCMTGKNIKIKADVVDCNIPLLLSRDSMKRAAMGINMSSDTEEVFG